MTAATLRKILVVDDHPDSAELSKVILQSEGHQVLEAFDGEAALKISETWLPDVVFADLLLPGMSGFEVVRQLRTQRRFDNTVTVALSGLTTGDAIARAIESEFDYFAAKPLDPALMMKAAYAPRQESLILLSDQLIELSKQIKCKTERLLSESHRIQERSSEIMKKWNAFSKLFGEQRTRKRSNDDRD